MKKHALNFTVKIVWGTEATRDDNENRPCIYGFETQKEMDAFLRGVDEAAGWLEYEIV